MINNSNKMIKKFESFKTEDYYQDITILDYLKLKEKHIYFNKNEISYLKNLGLEFEPDIIINFLDRSGNFIHGSLHKLEDEWFLFRNWQNDCFKCDQLEGVKKLLKDLHII